MKQLLYLSLFVLIGFSTNIYAHGGGQDSNGGHVNRSTGIYHCHQEDCVLPTVIEPFAPAKIKIATFNIKVFGKSKLKKPAVMSKLANIVKQFDLVAIQEIKDISGSTAPKFLEVINADGSNYDFIISDRTGRQANDKSSQEQYAYFYNTNTIATQEFNSLYDDSEHDFFQREPFVASFRVVGGNFDFVMITVHTRPDSAVEEMEALHNVVEWSKIMNPSEDDYIILGDYNADCTYASDEQVNNLSLHGAGYKWIVPNDADTNQSENTECAYDRIVITNAANDDYADDWGIVKVNDKKVSDHHVVWAEFHTGNNH